VLIIFCSSSEKPEEVDIYRRRNPGDLFIIEDIEKTNKYNQTAIQNNTKATCLFFKSAFFLALALIVSAFGEIYPLNVKPSEKTNKSNDKSNQYYFIEKVH
jgi:hypothetical protein